ncbi:CoA transferase [Rhodococcoides corynebacterioides]|uniref:CoA transferase n=2 Tax=Rhodococcoides corynebacterioides TaxID=53972 RepID=UPI000B00C4E1|nr:CoA transferase [Rhodococcus corynebacterioides]
MLDTLTQYEADHGHGRLQDIAVVPQSPGVLAGPLPVAALATGSVAALCSAVDRYCRAADLDPQPWSIDGDRVASSFGGGDLLRVNGGAAPGFAPLSGFWPTADGWVRTHANYPHHRDRLCALLGVPDDPAAVATALARVSAREIEDSAAAAGALVVAVRTPSEWDDEPAGRFAATGPLVTTSVRPDGTSSLAEAPTDARRPLAGMRVLDLTRVLAGPVATRVLALLGASVLRVDSPRLPEIETQHLDTGAGKASTLLDVEDPDQRDRLAALATTADVVVRGYRPGSTVMSVVESVRPGGAVVASVSAWGTRGPFAGRRGFDSLVQAASGIAVLCGRDDRPGALPVQALDHATGYLLAAGIVDALALRAQSGIGRTVTASLGRTAAHLLALPRSADGGERTPIPETHTVTHGSVRTARPALAEYDDYPWPARPWGSDEPRYPTPETV